MYATSQYFSCHFSDVKGTNYVCCEAYRHVQYIVLLTQERMTLPSSFTIRLDYKALAVYCHLSGLPTIILENKKRKNSEENFEYLVVCK